jgi:hypothetical protein
MLGVTAVIYFRHCWVKGTPCMWNPEHTLNPDGSFDFLCEFIAYMLI